MNDPEIRAISEVTKALGDLTDEQRRNVLLYVNARYGGQLPRLRAQSPSSADADDASLSAEEYANLGDLFDATDPQTEADRVLVVAWWLQVVKGADSFEAFLVSKELKHLGHPVSNITRAFDSLIKQTPRLVLQVGKTGKAKQARKRYKVTREGIRRVRVMLKQTNGDHNGN